MKKILSLALLASLAVSCSVDQLPEKQLPIIGEPTEVPNNQQQTEVEDVIVPGDAYTQDSLALVDFYRSTGGESWAKNLWTRVPLKRWNGVRLATVDGVSRVVSLRLVNMKLNGQLPVAIGQLSALQVLDLQENRALSGEIPAEISGLKSLRVLNLRFTGIEGVIPAQIGDLSKLDTLELSKPFAYHNDIQFSGSIPIEVAKLKSLRVLNLDNNALTGSIPTEIGELSSLVKLQMANNKLSGQLPASLGKLANLRVLFGGGNQFSGTMPAEICNLKSIEQIYLDNNKITGQIPSNIGNLATIYDLDMGSNQLTGSIPESILNLKNICILRFNDNQLSGEIPAEICNQNPILTDLSLQNNNLTGNIPVLTGFYIGDVAQKWYCSIKLKGNKLSGEIPTWILQFPGDCRKNLIPQQDGYQFVNQNLVTL